MEKIFFIMSVVILIITVFAAIYFAKKRAQFLKPSSIIGGGITVAATLLFVPLYVNQFKGTGCGVIETILISIHNTIRLFVIDGEFSFVTDNLTLDPTSILYRCYTLLFACLFIVAPVLTFAFVLSFFKNFLAYIKYYVHFYSNVYVFSELNDKSLALAKDLKQQSEKNNLIVFTEVFKKEEEGCFELIEQAKELNAICFKKDIAAIEFRPHSKKKEITIFTIGEDQSENVNQAIKLIGKFRNREKTNLYVCSTQVDTEILLSKAFDEIEGVTNKIKVRRVNEVKSLIVRNLYECGYDSIFESAYDDGSGVKKINAIVVGMGQHGAEMTKALTWFCQMDGYLAQIDSFDIEKKATEKFAALCPELVEFSGKLDAEGETQYTVNIHSGIDVDTVDFDNIIKKLPKTTYVFVALGSDEKNISAAIKLRILFERLGYNPVIQAIVYDSEKRESLEKVTNFKGQEYGIDFIGDIDATYSANVILGSDIEKKALERHLIWGKEEDFWRYSYNYNSSIASAIHRVMKQKCGIAGVDKKPEERGEEELWALRKLEHRRWNAYMRSEGYIYGETRKDLAKIHNCLVPFAELSLKEQEKDDD